VAAQLNPKQARAAQTRRRMLDAALRLFAELGYQSTTMAAVAKEAGVAQQTVYFTFHSKAELFQEVLVAARTAGDEPQVVEDRQWFTDALAAGDQRRALALACDGGIDIFRGLAPLAQAMVAAELVDPEVALTMDRIRSQRRSSMTQLVEALAANGPLAVPAGAAVDVIDVVLSMATFNGFVTERSWAVQRFKAWAYLTLTQLLPRLSPARASRADLAATADRTYGRAVADLVGPHA
jgi:AcrR family transcriptional regulator